MNSNPNESSRQIELKFSPIFILGMPRTGSTLLYQLLAQRFRVCYLSNFMMKYPSHWLIMAKISKFFAGCQPPNTYENHYGESKGWNGVNQGYKLWNQLFPSGIDYMGSNILSEKEKRSLRACINNLQSVYQAPFVNKWQKHTTRILPLKESFPEIIFIYIKRDLEYVAQSLLSGRRRLLKNERLWLSAQPKNFDEIKRKGPIEQVCEQAYFLDRDFKCDMYQNDFDRCFIIDYIELCENPELILNKFKAFYESKTGSELEIRGSIPRSFEIQDSIEVESSEFDQICGIIESLKNSKKQ